MHLEPGGFPGAAACVGSAVGRHQHGRGRRRAVEVVEIALEGTASVEAFEGDGIVDEFAEHGQRTAGRECFRVPQGVTHAEAKAVVFREDDAHGKRRG